MVNQQRTVAMNSMKNAKEEGCLGAFETTNKKTLITLFRRRQFGGERILAHVVNERS